MKKALFIEFHNISPHIETSFELVKQRLDAGDRVKFAFLGHNVPYREHVFLGKYEARLFRSVMPERRAARLVAHPNFEFLGGGNLRVRMRGVPCPQTLEELKDFTYKGADLGMGVASSLISRTLNSRFDPSLDKRRVRAAIAGSIAAYEYSRRLILDYEPDEVCLFNGRWCHQRAVLRAAESLGIATVIHERGANKDRFTARSFVPHDRKAVQKELQEMWGSVSDREEAIASARTWFEERRDGRPQDWHAFTALQTRKLLPDLPSGKRIVSYFSSSDDEFAAIGEKFQWVGWRDQLDAAKSLIDLVRLRPDDHLVVRLHPHMTRKHPDDLARWMNLVRGSESLTILAPESPVDSYAMLDASDLVITSGSTIGLEAVYWGKPSILLGPSDYDELGAVHLARSKQELAQLLEVRNLEAVPTSALPYGYYRGTYGQPYRYFKASGFVGGEFIGEDLHSLPTLPRFVNRGKERILRFLRPSQRLKRRTAW